MIIKTSNNRYFNALTGREVKPDRERGKHQNRIPDDCFRFLTQFAPSRPQMQKASEMQKTIEKNRERGIRITKKQSYWIRFVAWFKSLFNVRN